ncbi:MAG: MliC family protein [Halioglobus sp.]|nr:MliC family protein [Halioglobus sp.]
MRCRVFVLLSLSLTACGSSGPVQSVFGDTADFHPDDRPLATTLVYDCNGFDFVARLGPGEMAVWLPDRYTVLSQVRSREGTLYEESDVSFWRKGDDGILTVAGQSHLNCQLQPHRVPWEDARRRGVDFRGVGNEPGWHLEIQAGRQLLFVSGYGAERTLVTEPVETCSGSVCVYSGASGSRELRVEIAEEPCVDTMSGQQFPFSVEVTFNNAHYQGCGRSLDYPWEDID